MMLVQCRGRREWFKLGNDLDAATKHARDIQHYLRLHDWVETRRKYKPAFEAELCDVTVGMYLKLVEDHGQIWPPTFHGYASRLRRMLGMIHKFRFSGPDKFTGSSKASKWRLAADKILLNSITPQQVATWRDDYVAKFEPGTPERTRREHTANSTLRNARTLFSKRTIRRVLLKRPDLILPSPLPFSDVELIPERESDYFYRSEIDAKQLIEDAFAELSGNQLIAFILGIGAGLRRGEMDYLPWTHVDLPKGVVTVAPTQYTRLKSDSSVGKIQLEPRFADALRRHAAVTHGEFVLASAISPRLSLTQHRHCRCKSDFAALCTWLKGKGVKRTSSRIHTLRKEFGSHLAEKRGIFAASAGLRHSTIGVTRKYYVSSKIEPTAFFTTEEPVPPAHEAARLVTLLERVLEQQSPPREPNRGAPTAV
ncbi:MAG: tyrosine-type recombinase/integrase [Verrucomicrobia bacterium]|nr:tyrosine-type recombinase/integrase [Verrucomicrobiota bacterium]